MPQIEGPHNCAANAGELAAGIQNGALQSTTRMPRQIAESLLRRKLAATPQIRANSPGVESTAWICCAVRSELFPETKVDESDPEQKLLEWVLAGNTLSDYYGYVPPDLAEKIFDSGLLDESDGEAESEDKE